MAYTDTANMPLHMPTPGSREPAQIALLNENCVVLSTHDHTAGKGLATGRLRSGLQASRPAASTAGNVYFATDTGKFYVDTGTAWVEFITSGSAITATGWTLIDPIIRDTLQFGPEPTGAVDATITRTGAGALRVDTHLGVGVNPAVWRSDLRAIQVGAGMFLQGYATGASYNAYLGSNSYQDDTGLHAIVAGEGVRLGFVNGGYQFYTAPSVAAGALQTFTARASIAPTGTLTLTPDAGADALVLTRAGASPWHFGVGLSGAADDLVVMAAAGFQALRIVNATGYGVFGNAIMPNADNAVPCGLSTLRWASVWSAVGTIQTSSSAVKEGITPLSPAECYQAAKDVRWYEYAYLPPAYTPPEPPPDIAYDAADDNETKAEKKAARDEAEAASKAAHLKMVAETAPARHQRGFVFPAGAESKDEVGGALPPVPDLFGLSDRESTTPQADLATLGCAMQEIIRRLEALEGVDAPAS